MTDSAHQASELRRTIEDLRRYHELVERHQPTAAHPTTDRQRQVVELAVRLQNGRLVAAALGVAPASVTTILQRAGLTIREIKAEARAALISGRDPASWQNRFLMSGVSDQLHLEQAMNHESSERVGLHPEEILRRLANGEKVPPGSLPPAPMNIDPRYTAGLTAEQADTQQRVYYALKVRGEVLPTPRHVLGWMLSQFRKLAMERSERAPTAI